MFYPPYNPGTPSDAQAICSVMRVGRIHPPSKQVLRDISPGFYHGARVGVLGLDGSGLPGYTGLAAEGRKPARMRNLARYARGRGQQP